MEIKTAILTGTVVILTLSLFIEGENNFFAIGMLIFLIAFFIFYKILERLKW